MIGLRQRCRSLAECDADDPWMLIAVLSSSSRYADQMLAGVLALAAHDSQPQPAAYVRQLATVVGGRSDPQRIQAICKQLAELPDTPATRALEKALILGIGDGLKRSRRSFEQVLPGGSAAATGLIDRLLTQAAAGARDVKTPSSQRLDWIDLLTCSTFKRASPVLAELLEARQPQEIQMAAAHALAGFKNPHVTSLLLEALPRLHAGHAN